MYIHKHGVLFPSDIWSDSIFGIEILDLKFLFCYCWCCWLISRLKCVCVCVRKKWKPLIFPKIYFVLSQTLIIYSQTMFLIILFIILFTSRVIWVSHKLPFRSFLVWCRVYTGIHSVSVLGYGTFEYILFYHRTRTCVWKRNKNLSNYLVWNMFFCC